MAEIQFCRSPIAYLVAMLALSASAPSAEERSRPAWQIVLALLILAVAPLWHVHVIDRHMPSSRADLTLFSVGARTTLAGLDPYSEQVTRQIQTAYYGGPLAPGDQAKKMAYAYPAYSAILFAPLARLSWTQLLLAFLIVVPILMAASVPLWFSILEIPMRWSRIAIVTVLYLSSWPMMWCLRLQQPTLVVAALLVAGLVLLKGGWDLSAGLVFSLATIKPQLVGPLLLWLLIWSILQRNWRFPVSFLACESLLIAVSERMTPGWVSRWPAAMADYVQYTKVQPIPELLFGRIPGIVLVIAATFAAAVVLWRLRRCAARSLEFGVAVSVALAVTVALLPRERSMTYNDILLLPALLILIATTPADYYPALARRIAFTLVVWGFLAVQIAVLGETIFGPSGIWEGLPFQNALLPLGVFFALVYPLLASKPEFAQSEIATMQST